MDLRRRGGARDESVTREPAGNLYDQNHHVVVSEHGAKSLGREFLVDVIGQVLRLRIGGAAKGEERGRQAGEFRRVASRCAANLYFGVNHAECGRGLYRGLSYQQNNRWLGSWGEQGQFQGGLENCAVCVELVAISPWLH